MSLELLYPEFWIINLLEEEKENQEEFMFLMSQLKISS
jgi:hypothetical protein